MKTFAVFAKFWEQGKVKTRLADSIGHSYATTIYLMFLQMSLKISQGLDVNNVLSFSPQERQVEFEALAPGWDLIPQIESDLGSRMSSFFDQLFARHSLADHSIEVKGIAPGNLPEHRAVLIGSDSPLLPVGIVEDAFSKLVDHDVVIGPSHDGGYYLIGARNRTPDIFEQIDWSTEQVLEQTIERMEQRNYSYVLLPKHRDIDDLDDLIWMQAELKEKKSDRQDYLDLLQTIQKALQHGDPDQAPKDQVNP